MVKRFLVFIVLFPLLFSGCTKDTSDERIYEVLIGKWVLVATGCDGESWRTYKTDGKYDEYDGCMSLLRENAGSWSVKDQWLIIKSDLFPINVYHSFYYLSTTNMIIKRGRVDSSNPQIKYRKE